MRKLVENERKKVCNGQTQVNYPVELQIVMKGTFLGTRQLQTLHL